MSFFVLLTHWLPRRVIIFMLHLIIGARGRVQENEQHKYCMDVHLGCEKVPYVGFGYQSIHQRSLNTAACSNMIIKLLGNNM